MKTSSTSIRHRNGAALAHVAILVAGQIRTFEERAVQLNLRDKLVKPNQADVYFSLSPEDSPADWYNRYLFPQNKSVQLSSTIGADRLGSIMTSVRAFRPVYISIATDSDIAREQSTQWHGLLQNAYRIYKQSHLVFRWQLLLIEASKHEAKRGERYDLLVRMRPDFFVTCAPLDLRTLFREKAEKFDALFQNDFFMAARRAAAEVALRVYDLTRTFPPCTQRRKPKVREFLYRTHHMELTLHRVAHASR